MSRWPCSWWEPTGTVNETLSVSCPCGHLTRVELWPRALAPGDESRVDWDTAPWPTRCAACRRVFDFDGSDDFSRSSGQSREYRNPSTGEVVRTSHDLPPGALYDAMWLHSYRVGVDGRFLTCVLPNGHHWHIDSRASNCGRPDDDEHRCWVRHGEPPAIHVDKNGNTCPAGAGSIQSGDWHGFLHHGVLHL